jgi:hypothetical protein
VGLGGINEAAGINYLKNKSISCLDFTITSGRVIRVYMGAAVSEEAGGRKIGVLIVDGVEGTTAIDTGFIKQVIEEYARDSGFSKVLYSSQMFNTVAREFLNKVKSSGAPLRRLRVRLADAETRDYMEAFTRTPRWLVDYPKLNRLARLWEVFWSRISNGYYSYPRGNATGYVVDLAPPAAVDSGENAPRAEQTIALSHIISSAELLPVLKLYGTAASQMFVTDADRMPADARHIRQLDFFTVAAGAAEAKRVEVFAAVNEGSPVFYLDLRKAGIAQENFASTLRQGEPEITRHLRETTPALLQLRALYGRPVTFDPTITVDHYLPGDSLSTGEDGRLIVEPGWFEASGVHSAAAFTAKLDELKAIRNGENWAMGSSILMNLDDVTTPEGLSSSLAAATSTGNALMVINHAALSAMDSEKSGALAMIPRKSGGGVYINLSDVPPDKLISLKDYYRGTPVAGYIYASEGHVTLFDYATHTEHNVDLITGYHDATGLRKDIRRSYAPFKMINSSELRQLLRGDSKELRAGDERIALVEVLGSALTSLYNPETISSESVANVATNLTWQELPPLPAAREDQQTLVRTIDNADASVVDILTAMGLGAGKSGTVRTYVLEKLPADLHGTTRESEALRLQHVFLKAIAKAMFARNALARAGKVNGLLDQELSTALGDALYEQAETTGFDTLPSVTVETFLARTGKLNATNTFVQLNAEVRKLLAQKGEGRAAAINAVIILIPALAEGRHQFRLEKQRDEHLTQSMRDLLSAA